MDNITIEKDTVLGLYENQESANMGIEKLKEMGYSPQDISVIVRDAEEGQAIAKDTGAQVAEGAVGGAATGGVLGALAGLLVGLSAIAVPGFGGLLVGGPLAAALGLTGTAATTATGAMTGALAGGLIGALVGLGVPEEEAAAYEERLRQGGVLVAVPAERDGSDQNAEEVLAATGATQVRTLRA